jgi:PAS domain S-box-containing protein
MTPKDIKRVLGSKSPKDSPQNTITSQEKDTLRQRAEDILEKKRVNSTSNTEEMSSEEIRRKLHDLQVHQLELEMQNEELRRTQVELDAARARYFELYDLAPTGYCTLSEAGIIQEANLTTAILLGVTREQLVKQPISRYIFREDQDIYYLHRRQLSQAGDCQICELRLTGPDSQPKWFRLDMQLIKDTDGTLQYRTALIDINDHKLVEKAHARLESQYRQAQKMESVGRLAGGVAHDFNNKLTIILGYVELIMNRIDPSDSIFADLTQIHCAAKHSADLTSQLLAFARKQVVVPKEINLNEAIEGMVAILKRLIGEDIALTWLPKAGLWSVKMDNSQIDQIISNLCVNARDAISGNGTIKIETGNAILDEAFCADNLGVVPGKYVSFTVTDDGCGMDKDVQGKIFEPFFSTKEKDKGTGLGLATVYGIVKQNNGFIAVYSEPDLGTTIKIFLPRYVGKTVNGFKKAAAIPAMGSNETILVVEDESAILKMTTRILESAGYNVLSANTTSEALHLAEECTENLDLILTDVIMPEMNGCELARQITAFYPKLKILFMSGYTFDVIAKQGNLDANAHFIQKPFTNTELTAKVDEILKNSQDNSSGTVADQP